ncbi:MAG: phosphatase PAP2 family protein [Lachnospiraceae bacterium]|nr:phosphatase PAP2 family protein [Lachnospiraceae bacterium]
MKKYISPAILFAAFIVYTITVKFVDVAAVGPLGSSVGFSHINSFVAGIFTYNDFFYKLTKIIGLFSFMCVGAFAIIGLAELIKKKSLKKVDFSIYAMALIYIITAVLYVLFEILVINYRPILEDGELEASYPSSHTMLAVSIFGSACVYFAKKIENTALKMVLTSMCVVFAALMPVGRMISGVHWFTDIIGGVLLGCAIVSFYMALFNAINQTEK